MLQNNREHRKVLYEKSGFTKEIEEAAEEAIARLCQNEADVRFYNAVEDELFSGGRPYPLILEYAEKTGWRVGELLLACAVLHTERSKVVFESRKLPEHVYYGSMRDIVIWSKTDSPRLGYVGLWDHYQWTSGLLSGRILRVGRLEFEVYSHFRLDHGEICGIPLTPQSLVVDVHIPEDGPMLPELCHEAYREVYRLFGMKGKTVFSCGTWFLYPPMRKLLPDTSNIRHFMDDYKILHEEEKKNSPDLRRIFGYRDSFVPSELPRKTTLQSAVADYLAEGGHLGEALGVFLFDGDTIDHD